MIRLVSGFVAGVAVCYAFASSHYQGKIRTIEADARAAQEQRDDEFTEVAAYWQAELAAANDKPATVERVLVKASCVPAAGSAGLDDAGAAARIELAEANTRRLAGVISDAESRYRACSHRLRAFQELHKKE